MRRALSILCIVLAITLAIGIKQTVSAAGVPSLPTAIVSHAENGAPMCGIASAI
jgi:hypothetical protein